MTDKTPAIHAFEKAGLGRAPFRCVGVEERRGPIVVSEAGGVTTTIGAPGQPMGVCDFCGTGIAECYLIRSTDGRDFIVGSDCVRKTGDAGLLRQLEPHLREKRRAAADRANERKDARIEAAREALATNEALREDLSAKPHPRGFNDRATGLPLTALDELEWTMLNAGRKGKLAAAKEIEGHLARISGEVS
jgi:hypothetical protein